MINLNKKIGEKVEMICYQCDGSGIEPPIITTNQEESISGASKPCVICGGSGKIMGIVTKQ